MDSEEFGESTSTPPVTEQAEGWEKAEGSFLEDEYFSAIEGFVCLSTHASCEQTNKQNCQIIFLTHVKCGDIERILNLGKHYAQRALTRFKMGNYSRTPPCMMLMFDTSQNGQLFKNHPVWGLCDQVCSPNYSFPQNGHKGKGLVNFTELSIVLIHL